MVKFFFGHVIKKDKGHIKLRKPTSLRDRELGNVGDEAGQLGAGEVRVGEVLYP